MDIPQQTVAELKQKHGEIFQLEHAEGTVVVCRPNREEWKRFRLSILDENKQGHAIEDLVRACVVYPSRQEFDAMLSRTPGLAEAFGRNITELAGSTGAVQKKTL